MKIAGIILIAIGLIDLLGSYAGFDLWGEFLHIQLPDLLWNYSHFIEIAAGYGLMTLGDSGDEGEHQEPTEA